MLIKMQSPRTGQINERELDISQHQLDLWRGGMNIQDAMPNLTNSEREFLMTGYTDEDWEAIWGPEDEEFDDEDPRI